MNVLSINGLSKSFGSQRVLDNLTLQVPEGAVFGFVGQNGAGKTTTMKLVLGLMEPDGGSISVCGETVAYGQTKTNRHIGYLPDVLEFYNHMKPLEYLALCGEITGLSRDEIRERSAELLTLVGLSGAAKRIGGFSRGMKQRLGIAQALLSRPKLLLCDEPTSALDPVGRKEILDILQRIKDSTTVIFSTHILSDVERICDRAAILNHGSIAVSGTLAEIKSLQRRDSLFLEFMTAADLRRFKACPGTAPLLEHSEETGMDLVLHGTDSEKMRCAVIGALAEAEVCPARLELAAPSLENLFLEVVK